ncbi:hypothetical protein FA09DRAFT_327316 [Tilletiopsis washingtonensis]|uniref:Protein kinase domain-containing protein n=1 Tax=Tilletiopsis washingtonensis TaxID=58919 RepID=A0A316ZHY7_9BASI|nr:hypothetical protein FA09DRAFT_327316 [Tilletiopsis washingtonensis]PWO01388.1 hypothetical protein FA09DRAFT_327316 [Tilletiopsis washingtonensis]
MASFLSQASSYFGRTHIASTYTIDDAVPAVHAGLWKIQRASRKASAAPAAAAGAGASGSAAASASSNGSGRDVVSVWSHAFTARGQERVAVAEMLKKEAASLTRLRHPCVLETVEPLEETRSELIFATEPVLAPLSAALLSGESAGRAADGVQLDEVEIQKGVLQVARALEFLHTAKMVHGNLNTDAVLINAKGDWKLAGFSFLTPLAGANSAAPAWSLDYDPSLPPQLSRDFNYVAPEYALDERLEPANDMYSLGCLVFAIHSRGSPPFRNRNAITNIRANAEELGTKLGDPAWARLGKDVLELLSTLLTRFPGARPSAAEFQNSQYFNNVLVRTLKFMERDNFAGRTKEERVQFLKGLLKIMDQFSHRLQHRKVLPALLELMNDRTLLPFILPNVFVISQNLSSIEFTSNVLPRLKPLFSVQDPPQNQLILLDQIELFVTKTTPPIFREEVTPLLYSALEAEQVMVQERALQTVPRLCEILEFSHVKEVLFPNIAKLFSKTKVLSCKISTLMCFHSMIGVLDKFTLTEKLVPILARVKTREPSVMIAILAVHEAMAKKVDRETLAVAIIPQLWAMSMGAQLTADQFQRFMKTVREMGERVEKEHMLHLREQRNMQEHTESYVGAGANGRAAGGGSLGGGVTGIGSSGEIDFATLVGGGPTSSAARAEVPRDAAATSADPFGWDDLGSTSNTPAAVTPALTPSHTGSLGRPAAVTPALTPSHTGTLGRPAATSAALPAFAAPPLATRSALAPPPSSSPRPSLQAAYSSSSLGGSSTSAAPPGWAGSTLAPAPRNSLPPAAPASTSGPNYNLNLEPASGFGSTALAPSSFGSLPPLQPQTSSLGFSSLAPAPAPAAPPKAPAALSGPPGWGGAVLQPTARAGSSAPKAGAAGNNAWDDFDPLR